MTGPGNDTKDTDGTDGTGPWRPDDTVTVAELEATMRAVHAIAMRTGFAADRVEALLMASVKALLDGGQLDRAAFDRALAERQTR
jgi:hypothetical protein